jgi:hypothetical protein
MPALCFAFLHPRLSVVHDVDPGVVDSRGRDDLVVGRHVDKVCVAGADSGPRAQGSDYVVVKMCLGCLF